MAIPHTVCLNCLSTVHTQLKLPAASSRVGSGVALATFLLSRKVVLSKPGTHVELLEHCWEMVWTMPLELPAPSLPPGDL